MKVHPPEALVHHELQKVRTLQLPTDVSRRMANTYFSFKQFTVHQHLCAMKVGIDCVLLGAWASPENCSRILVVGSPDLFQTQGCSW